MSVFDWQNNKPSVFAKDVNFTDGAKAGLLKGIKHLGYKQYGTAFIADKPSPNIHADIREKEKK